VQGEPLEGEGGPGWQKRGRRGRNHARKSGLATAIFTATMES
jgi:hypothetical protein